MNTFQVQFFFWCSSNTILLKAYGLFKIKQVFL